MSVEWNGPDVAEALGKRIDQQMLDLGARVVAEAQKFVHPHSKTFKLESGMHFDYNLSTHTLVFSSDVDYDIFTEYGTRNMLPFPHWRPALESVGAIYGFHTELAFGAVPFIHQPLRAVGPTFHGPKTLTAKQREHIAHALVPTSKRLWAGRPGVGNVRRTPMHIRHKF